jgi:hypothetical protein
MDGLSSVANPRGLGGDRSAGHRAPPPELFPFPVPATAASDLVGQSLGGDNGGGSLFVHICGGVFGVFGSCRDNAGPDGERVSTAMVVARPLSGAGAPVDAPMSPKSVGAIWVWEGLRFLASEAGKLHGGACRSCFLAPRWCR